MNSEYPRRFKLRGAGAGAGSARSVWERIQALQLHCSVPARLRSARFPRPSRSIVITAGVLVLALGAIAAAVPRAPTGAERVEAFVLANAQSISVSPRVPKSVVTRDAFSATPGIATYVAGGTNHDWAKLVMLFAGFPVTDSNVTVFTRWMRQENGSDDWFNRNNPLNNGWGSGGGGGLGSYDSLVIAAENAADALHSVGGYGAIVDAFAASARTEVIESAIWASPWASGHLRGLLATMPTEDTGRTPRHRSSPPPRALRDS